MLQKTLEGSLDRTSTSSAILSLHQRLAQAFLHSYLVANHTPQTAFSSFPTASSSSCCIHRQQYTSSPILERAILDLISNLAKPLNHHNAPHDHHPSHPPNCHLRLRSRDLYRTHNSRLRRLHDHISNRNRPCHDLPNLNLNPTYDNHSAIVPDNHNTLSSPGATIYNTTTTKSSQLHPRPPPILHRLPQQRPEPQSPPRTPSSPRRTRGPTRRPRSTRRQPSSPGARSTRSTRYRPSSTGTCTRRPSTCTSKPRCRTRRWRSASPTSTAAGLACNDRLHRRCAGRLYAAFQRCTVAGADAAGGAGWIGDVDGDGGGGEDGSGEECGGGGEEGWGEDGSGAGDYGHGGVVVGWLRGEGVGWCT